jgi:hypothetical protein
LWIEVAALKARKCSEPKRAGEDAADFETTLNPKHIRIEFGEVITELALSAWWRFATTCAPQSGVIARRPGVVQLAFYTSEIASVRAHLQPCY